MLFGTSMVTFYNFSERNSGHLQFTLNSFRYKFCLFIINFIFNFYVFNLQLYIDKIRSLYFFKRNLSRISLCAYNVIPHVLSYCFN